jgi:hypothetical protein
MTDHQIREIASNHRKSCQLGKGWASPQDIVAIENRISSELTTAIRILEEAGYVVLNTNDEPTHEMLRAGSDAVSFLTHKGAACCFKAMLLRASQQKEPRT